MGICSSTKDGYGVRPSINLKSGVEFTGSGTKSNPYKIVGDKEGPASEVLISSRSSGEYVNLIMIFTELFQLMKQA